MRIVHVSQQDDESGGFKAAYRLHTAMIRAGHDSRMVVLAKTTRDPSVIPVFRPLLLAKVMWRLLGWMNDAATRGYHRQPRCGWTASHYSIGALQTIRRLQPDVVQLHLFDCLLTYREVARLPYPVFWTFHDMGAITGGCHCTPDCLRYRDRCGRCPELGSESDNDASSRGWIHKHEAWRHPNLTAITPSRWLEREAAASPMCAGHRVVRIPNGVPLETFHPGLRKESRIKLGFKDSTFYLLAGSAALSNELKGFRLVVAAAQQLAAKQPEQFELITFGRGTPDLPGVPHRHVGYLRDDAELARLYAASDAYVLPTLVDNLPNMLIESIACGTPCVTFDVGGCPDVVRNDQTGVVVTDRTPQALAHGINTLMQMHPDAYHTLRHRCRAVAEAEYGLSTMARAYLATFATGLHEPAKFRHPITQ
jgi:glycosyltransferase involved in cell wall biosynthesis